MDRSYVRNLSETSEAVNVSDIRNLGKLFEFLMGICLPRHRAGRHIIPDYSKI